MVKYYPGLTNTTGTITSSASVVAGDYNDIVFTGATKDGNAITITVENALNLSNLDWKFEDKSEVVPTLEFTATYEEDSDTPPWNVVLA